MILSRNSLGTLQTFPPPSPFLRVENLNAELSEPADEIGALLQVLSCHGCDWEKRAREQDGGIRVKLKSLES